MSKPKTKSHENVEKEKKDTKDKSVKVRLTEESWERLKDVCDEKEITVSRLLRDLVDSYLDFRYTIIPLGGMDRLDKPYESVVISRPMFKEIFNDLPPDKIEELADLDYNIGMEDGRRLFPNQYDSEEKVAEISSNPKKLKKEISWMLDLMIKYAFGKETRNWFEQIRYESKGATFRIIGKHHNGENFSVFFIMLISRIMGNLKYEMAKKTQKTLKEFEYIDLTFKPK